MDSKKIWAVITGAIRDEYSILSILARLVDFRKTGKISYILLSTWMGEIDQYPTLRNKLNQLNIFIIESNSFDYRDGTDLPVNHMRQAFQLHQAMDRIPDDVFVLKVRTDRALGVLNSFEELITKKDDISIKRFGNFPIIFNYKVVALSPKPIYGLHFTDFVYFGHKSDIRKLIMFEVPKVMLGKSLSVNIQTFIQPFFHSFPILFDYYRNIRLNKIEKKLPEFAKNNDELILPDFLNTVYATVYLILYSHFLISTKCNHVQNEKKDELEFHELFSGSKKYGVVIGPRGPILNDQSTIDDVVEGRLKKTEGYIKFYNEIVDLSRNNHETRYQEGSYKQLSKFGQNAFNYEPKEWLHTFKRISKFSDYDQKDEIAILFSEYEFDPAIYSFVQSTYDKKEQAKEIYLQIKERNIKNPKFQEMVLIASARDGYRAAFAELSECLALGLLSKKYYGESLKIINFFIDWNIKKDKGTGYELYALFNLLKIEDKEILSNKSYPSLEDINRYYSYFTQQGATSIATAESLLSHLKYNATPSRDKAIKLFNELRNKV